MKHLSVAFRAGFGVHCDECAAPVDEAYQIGEDEDYESATLMLCRQHAIEMFEILRDVLFPDNAE